MRLPLAAAAAALLIGLPAVAPAQKAPGYLAGREPDAIAIVPPAPRPGDARDLMDMAVFRATRALKTTAPERWALATHDADLSPASLFADFDCAIGARLTPQNTPTLLAMIRRLAADVSAAYAIPKDVYKRPRPYVRESADICVPHSKDLDEGYDYPSGHATFAWTFGSILAEAAPDRAGPLLQRARAIGESRVVCGVHTLSAVTEARTAAAGLVDGLNASDAFRADLAAVTAEIAAARKAGPPAAEACAAEQALISRRLW